MKSLSIAVALARVVSAISLWDTTGPYQVGYTQHIFDHVTVNDTTQPGTFMLVTIYYPTLQCADNKPAPYLDPILGKFYETTVGLTPGSLSSKLTTNLQRNAPTLLGTSPAFGNATSPYPTLVFTPGAGVSSSAYTAYLSELASTGYTVIAIDHPGEAPYLALPTRYNGSEGAYGFANFSAYPPTDEDIWSCFGFRQTDVLAAMSPSYIPALVYKEGLPINLTHVGVFGHSIGGAAAGAIMAQSPLFLQGANLDGTFFQAISKDFQSIITPPDNHRPFLELGGMEHFDGNASSDITFEVFNNAQTGWTGLIQVNKTRHLDFSDIPLWLERLNESGSSDRKWTGGLGGSKIIRLTSEVMKKFWAGLEGKGLGDVDEYVKKERDLEWLLLKNAA